MQRWRMPLVARKRELIDTGTDKRYVRRNKRKTSFVESDDVGRSLAADRRLVPLDANNVCRTVRTSSILNSQFSRIALTGKHG